MSAAWLDILWFVVFMIVILIALIANLIIILAILRDRSMHTSTYFYIINVDIADIILILSCLPERIAALFHPNDEFPLGMIACYLVPFFQQVSMHAALGLLLILTVHRCYPTGVPNCLQHNVIRQQIRNYSQTLCLVWIFAVLINLPLFSITKYDFQTISAPDNQSNTSERTYAPTCGTEAKEIWSRTYLILLLAFTYVITGIFLIVIYGRVIRIMVISSRYSKKINEETRHNHREYHFLTQNLKKQDPLQDILARTSASTSSMLAIANRSRKRNSSDTPAVSVMLPTETNQYPTNSRSIQRVQVIIMLFIVILLYILLLLPYRLVNLLFIVYNQLFQQNLMNEVLLHWLLNIVRLLVFINCALQPIIYLIISSKLRQTVVKFLQSCCFKYHFQCQCSLSCKTTPQTVPRYRKKQVIRRDPQRLPAAQNLQYASYHSLPLGRTPLAANNFAPYTKTIPRRL
ncbi:unnamed protein product [Adineta ricciae]|uniref:G-protein coupled receptors family 1 profile domain-containing protein n=1 Tax=Adineta ricciae TaxID=249248 RepID=A0A814FFB1_ADIRI|nr:unnamed protein product [Adineta ricciae]